MIHARLARRVLIGRCFLATYTNAVSLPFTNSESDPMVHDDSSPFMEAETYTTPVTSGPTLHEALSLMLSGGPCLDLRDAVRDTPCLDALRLWYSQSSHSHDTDTVGARPVLVVKKGAPRLWWYCAAVPTVLKYDPVTSPWVSVHRLALCLPRIRTER